MCSFVVRKCGQSLLSCGLGVVLLTGVAATAQASHITGVTVDSFSSELGSGYVWANTVNDSGMSGDLGPLFDTHDNVGSNQGVTSHAAGGVPGIVAYNLGAVYELDTIAIWNFDDGTPGLGNANYFLEGSLNGVDYEGITNGVIDMADGTAANAVDEVIDMSVLNNTYQYIRITMYDNWSGGAFYLKGLAEIRFYEVPEPASLALMGLGGIAMLARRRRT